MEPFHPILKTNQKIVDIAFDTGVDIIVTYIVKEVS